MAIFNNADKQRAPEKAEQRDIRENRADEPMGEEEKLADEIRKTEAEIDAIYTEIGREYYEKNSEEPQSGEMVARFRQIGEKREMIKGINDRIRTLKGITTCGKCGADVLMGDTFCPSCGARIISEVTISAAGRICPNCGHEIKTGQLYCTTCGAKVTISDDVMPDEIETEKTRIFAPNAWIVPMQETAGDERGEEDFKEEEPIPTEPDDEEVEWEDFEVPEPEKEAEPEPEGTVPEGAGRCPNCGEILEAGLRFCIFCGTPLSENADQGSQQSAGRSKACCEYCGEPLEPDDKFCINCGRPVR